MDDKNQILERTDPAIKLFGKSIQLPETSSEPSRPADAACGGDDVDERRPCGMDSGVEDESDDEGNVGEEMLKHERENGNLHKPSQQDAASGTDENLETPVGQSKTTALSSSRTEETKSETTLQQETPLKKPEKIIPCPRCASMDTKFCYFNNHNVNQPRYFCRKCQRYWTSGGTMRNLPVGAGRRKSKSSAVHYPLIAVPIEFQSASASHTNGVTHRPVALNGSVLNFVQDKDTQGSSSPKIVDKARPASALNGSGRPKECKTPIQCEAGIVVDDNLSGSAGSFSNIENGDEYKAEAHTANSYQCFQPQMLYIPAPVWPPYPWNPALSPVNYRPGFPMPVYPAPIYMGCALPGAWNMPWSAHSSSPNVHSDDKYPILGKRSRDDNVVKSSNDADEGNPKPSIWIPKTLRLDDLEEAAKSSMWATLGIKNDDTVSSCCKGHFKPFSSLAAETSHSVSTTSSALLANPAALSRSMNFHESS